MLAQSVGSLQTQSSAVPGHVCGGEAAVVVVSRWAACTRQQNGTAQARGFNCLLIRERGTGFLVVSPPPRTRDTFCVERSGLTDPIMST